MFQIDGSGSAIVLAGAVYRFGRETSNVLRRAPVENQRILALPVRLQSGRYDEFTGRNRGDHALEHLFGLCHEGPVPGIQRPFTRGVLPHVSRGHDVEKGDRDAPVAELSVALTGAGGRAPVPITFSVGLNVPVAGRAQLMDDAELSSQSRPARARFTCSGTCRSSLPGTGQRGRFESRICE